MKLCDLLTDSVVAVGLAASSKSDLLAKLVNLAAHDNKVQEPQVALKAVEDRERIMTTGIGHGVAIPHGKTDAVKDLVAAFAVLCSLFSVAQLREGRWVQLLFSRDS